jgi:hypothetical protein
MDEVGRQMEHSIRAFVQVSKQNTYTSKGKKALQMVCLSGTILGLYETTDAHLFAGDYMDAVRHSRKVLEVPRVTIDEKKKYKLADSAASKAFPPTKFNLYGFVTLHVIAQKASALTPFDVLAVDVYEMFTPYTPGSKETGPEQQAGVQLRPWKVNPITGNLAGRWNVRYINCVSMLARFNWKNDSTSHFRSVFLALLDANANAKATDEKVFMDVPSCVLVVFGGRSDQPSAVYFHDAQRDATLCSLGWDSDTQRRRQPVMMATGPATAAYAPLTDTSKAPIDVSFNLMEYSKKGDQEQVLMTTQPLSIFQPTEGLELSLFPGLPFSYTAEILTGQLASYVYAILAMHGKWLNTNRGRPADPFAASNSKREPCLPTASGMIRMAPIPGATATTGSAFYWHDIVFSGAVIRLAHESPLVAAALEGKIVSTSAAKISEHDVDEVRLRVTGAVLALGPKVPASVLAADLCYFAVDYTGQSISDRFRAMTLEDAPGSKGRADSCLDIFKERLVVCAVVVTPAVWEHITKHGDFPRAPIATSMLSEMSAIYFRQQQPHAATGASAPPKVLEIEAAPGRAMIQASVDLDLLNDVEAIEAAERELAGRQLPPVEPALPSERRSRSRSRSQSESADDGH